MSYENDKPIIESLWKQIAILDKKDISNFISTRTPEELEYVLAFCSIMKDEPIIQKINTALLSEIAHDMKPEIDLKFDNDGNLLLSKKDKCSFMEIYSNSHRLLKMYEKHNNIEGIKYELCKLYYINLLIENKTLYPHGINTLFNNDAKKKEATKVRAFVLNDFNKYLNYVLSKEKDFNFSDYFNKTKFGIHSMSISQDNIKNTTKLLKSIFQ